MDCDGTYAGYQRHRRAGEVPCKACCAAYATYQREYRRRKVSQPLVAAIYAEGWADAVKAMGGGE